MGRLRAWCKKKVGCTKLKGVAKLLLLVKLSRRQRDRTAIIVGWVVAAFLELLVWRLFQTQLVLVAITVGAWCFLTLLYAAVTTRRREKRQEQRIQEVVNEVLDEGEKALNCRRRCIICCRSTSVVCAYTGNDVLPMVASCAVWGFLVSILTLTLFTILYHDQSNLFYKCVHMAGLAGAILTLLVVAGGFLYFKRVNKEREHTGWQWCAIMTVVIFYSGAIIGFVAPYSMLNGALLGLFLSFYFKTPLVAWLGAGCLVITCICCPLVFLKFVFRSKSSAVAFAFAGPEGVANKAEAADAADMSKDTYVSLLEYSFEDASPTVFAKLCKHLGWGCKDWCAQRVRCWCCRPKAQAEIHFDNPLDSLLAEALLAGRFAAARGLVARGASVDGIEGNKSMLRCAMEGGNAECLKLIFDNRVNVNKVAPAYGTEPDGFRPIHVAATLNRPDVLQQLIAKGANTAMGTEHRNISALRVAALAAHTECVKVLLDRKKPKKTVLPQLKLHASDGGDLNWLLKKLLRRASPDRLEIVRQLLAAAQQVRLKVDPKLEKQADDLLRSSSGAGAGAGAGAGSMV